MNTAARAQEEPRGSAVGVGARRGYLYPLPPRSCDDALTLGARSRFERKIPNGCQGLLRPQSVKKHAKQILILKTRNALMLSVHRAQDSGYLCL